MRNQNFGIEIEMTGLTRAAAAKIIAGYFGTDTCHIGGGFARLDGKSIKAKGAPL